MVITRTKILLGFAIIVLAFAIGTVFYARNKANQQANNIPVQTPPSQSQSGGVTEVTPSPVYDGRGNLILKTDPTKPFVAIAPRSQEPSPTQVAQGGNGSGAGGNNVNFQNYQQAIDQGLIPDQNGMYTQTVSPTGFNTYQQKAVDYSLPDDQFLATYYGGAQNVSDIINGTTPADIAANAQDPIVVNNNSSSPQTVPLADNVNASLFSQTSNDQASYRTYITAMSNATKPFDLIHDGTTVSKIFNATSDQQLNAYKAQAQQVQNAIKNIAVPPSLLGLSEEYYQTYQDYENLIDTMIAYSDAGNSGADTTDSSYQFGQAYGSFTNDLDQVKNDISIATNIVNG